MYLISQPRLYENAVITIPSKCKNEEVTRQAKILQGSAQQAQPLELFVAFVLGPSTTSSAMFNIVFSIIIYVSLLLHATEMSQF